MNQRKPLTIRLTPEARDALERLAQREGRSLSSYIEWTVRQQAQQQGAWKPNQTGIKAVSL